MKTRRLGLLLAALLALFPLARAEDAALWDAFSQAAFTAEYGEEGVDALRRWEAPIRVWQEGEATPEDLTVLDAFMAELNARVPGLPPVSYAENEGKANFRVIFAPYADFPGLSPIYVPGNWGFFAFWYGGDYVMDRAQVLIASDVATPAERAHLLLEEITGALGLVNDIKGYPGSILTEAWTVTQQLGELDWQLLNLLYDSRLRPGMGMEEAKAALGL